jgi:hypothetical protein
LGSKGFLRQLIDELKAEDTILQDLLIGGFSPTALNRLFVYESKMSVLLHIAETTQGARRLGIAVAVFVA